MQSCFATLNCKFAYANIAPPLPCFIKFYCSRFADCLRFLPRLPPGGSWILRSKRLRESAATRENRLECGEKYFHCAAGSSTASLPPKGSLRKTTPFLFALRSQKFVWFLGSSVTQALPRGEGGPLAVDEENGIEHNKRRSPHPSAPSSHPPSPRGKAYGKRCLSCSPFDCENSIVLPWGGGLSPAVRSRKFDCFTVGRGLVSRRSIAKIRLFYRRAGACLPPFDRKNSIVYRGRFLNRPYDDRVIFCRGHSRMTRGESCGKRCLSCSPIDCGNLFGFLDRRGRRSLRVLHEFYCSLTRPLFQKDGER